MYSWYAVYLKKARFSWYFDFNFSNVILTGTVYKEERSIAPSAAIWFWSGRSEPGWSVMKLGEFALFILRSKKLVCCLCRYTRFSELE